MTTNPKSATHAGGVVAPVPIGAFDVYAMGTVNPLLPLTIPYSVAFANPDPKCQRHRLYIERTLAVRIDYLCGTAVIRGSAIGASWRGGKKAGHYQRESYKKKVSIRDDIVLSPL